MRKKDRQFYRQREKWRERGEKRRKEKFRQTEGDESCIDSQCVHGKAIRKSLIF